MSNRKLIAPHSILIEKVATEFACTFYEVGRSQGMTSKHKNAKLYAQANLEKFLPKAIDHLLDILNNPSTDNEMKVMIYDALSERVNDPNNITSGDIKGLPDIDITKLLANIPAAPPSQQLKPVREAPINIKSRLHNGTAIGKVS